MIDIPFISDNQEIDTIIRIHINKKTAELVKWYISEYGIGRFLPNTVLDKDPSCLKRLIDALEEPTVKKLDQNDNMTLVLIGCLEAEEVCREIKTAPFLETERKRLESNMIEPSYFEDFSNYKDLLMPIDYQF